MEELNATRFFSSLVYSIHKPEFLEIARQVSYKFIKKRKSENKLNSAFPAYMTENMFSDPQIFNFSKCILAVAWDILVSQGYDMSQYKTYFTEMWCQEHHYLSSMERHIHGGGSVITGFYFLDCPKDSCKVVVHDPRDSKVIMSLPQKDEDNISHGSNVVNFEPKDGLLMFTNSWLPHSFTKNLSYEPTKFIHFNIAVTPSSQSDNICRPKAEVI